MAALLAVPASSHAAPPSYFNTSGISEIQAVLSDPGEGIVAVGAIDPCGGPFPCEGPNGLRIFELSSEGKRDPDFAGGRALTLPPTGTPATVVGLARAPDGGYIVGTGSLGSPAPAGVALTKLTSAGEIDPTFGVAGRAQLPTSDLIATGMTIDSQGRILVSGSPLFNDDGFTLTRFAADGHLDESFGQAGFATVNAPGAAANAVLAQPGGGLLAAGGVPIASAVQRPGVATFGTDGETAGSSPQLLPTAPASFANVAALVPGSTGTAYVAGTSVGGPHSCGDPFVARVDGDLQLDPDFNGRGLVTGGSRWCGFVSDAIADRRGGIAIASTAASKIQLTRFDASGRARRFGAHRNFEFERKGVQAIAQALGRTKRGFVVGGSLRIKHCKFQDEDSPPCSEMALIKVMSNGDLDRRFGDDGVLVGKPVRGALRK